MKIKRLLKSVVSLVLVATICLCMTVMGVNAVPEDSDYSKRATAMINFFHNKNSGIDVKDISPEEFRVFGVFLSNFVLPMNTDLCNIDNTLKAEGNLKKEHNAWELFCKAFGKDKDEKLLDTLLSTYKGVINSSINEDSRLYYNKDGEDATATVGTLLSWISLAYGGETVYWKDGDTKHTVFDTSTEVGKAAFMLSIGSVITTVSDTDGKISKRPVYVTPFGDIVYELDEQIKVLVPACLNPYTYSKEGDKLYLNNSFAIGCLLSENDVDIKWKEDAPNSTDTDKTNYYKEDLYKWLNNFLKYGNYSAYFYCNNGVSVFDHNGSGHLTFAGDYTVSRWTIDTLKIFTDKKGTTSIGVTNIDKGIRKCVSDDLKKAADDFHRGLFLNEQNDDVSIRQKLFNLNSNNADYKPPFEVTGEYDSYVTIFSNIFKCNDASSAVKWDVLNAFNGDDTQKYNGVTLFQIPIEQTVSKIAIFNDSPSKVGGWDTDKGLSVVKDSYLLTTADKVSNSLSVMCDMMQKNGVTMAKDKVISETMTCLNKSVASIIKGTQYVENGNKIANNANLWAGIYWAYLEDLAGLALDADTGVIDFNTPLDFNWLPKLDTKDFSGSLKYYIENGGTETDSEGDMSDKQQNIINWTYDILNTDSINNATRVNWLKSIIDGLFLGMHNAMVGVDIAGTITSVGNANQSGVYHSVMGYVTTPTFSEMPITNWIMDNYVLVYIILMLIVTVLLVVMVMSKTRRMGAAVFTFVMMMFILLLPAELLNGGILFSNKVAEDMFGSKFTYWAIVQHAQYVNNKNSVEESATAESSESVADTAVDNVISSAIDDATASQQLGDNGITVKWLAPKKYGLTEKIQQQAQDANSNLQLFTYFTEQLFKGEIYSADENSTFLYRTYYSLYTSAASGHNSIIKNGIKNASGGVAENEDLSAVILSSWNKTFDSKWSTQQKTNFMSKNVALNNEEIKKKRGIVDKKRTPDGLGMMLRSITGGVYISEDGTKTNFPAGYQDSYFGDLMKPLRNEYVSSNRIATVLTDSTLNTAVFNFVNIDTKLKGLDLGTKPNATASENVDNFKKGVSAGVNEFLLYTESPYYYFYNVFSDVKVNNGAIKGSSDFVRVLLDEDFFKVNDENSTSYGEFKDFLDFEGLFTYIIPYLNYANSDVKQYESTYGMTVDRSQFTGKNAEANYNARCQTLQNVWNLYSPWVDALYEVNGSSSQQARSGYDTVSIDDPLNPASYYYKGRPMVFSQAQAKLRGYAESDLTDVEYKLQKVLKATYDDMIELLNYKDFAGMENGSDILISAAAMMATFNFNQEFSDTSFLSNGVTLYPLSFEMKNMNYDAFLRLIIANSTYTLSSSTMDSTGLYSNLIHNTSFITALILILVDIVAVYIIPALKILLMVAMLALGLFMAISCALSKPEKLAKTICTSFVVPLLCTVGVFILHTIMIGLFMGNGMTGVIEYKNLSLSTGDPTITLLLLLVVDAVTALLLLKLFKKVGKDLIKYIKMTFEFAKGLTIGAAGAAIAGVIGTVKGAAHYGVGVPANHIAAKVSRHKDAKANANANQRATEKAEKKKSSGNGSKANSGNGGSTPKPTQQTSQQKAQKASQSQNKQQQGNGSQNGKSGGSNGNSQSNNGGRKTFNKVINNGQSSNSSTGSSNKSTSRSNRDIKISSANIVIKNANSSSNSFSNKYYKSKRTKSSNKNKSKKRKNGGKR